MRAIFSMIIIGAGLLLGCESYTFNGTSTSGGASSSSSTANLTPAVIATTTEGSEATSMVLQSKELLVTSTDLFRNLGFIAQSQMVSAASGTGTASCADYGSYDYVRTYANGTYTIACTFNLCRENDFQYGGTYRATGTPASFTGRISSGLTILNFKNNYTTLIGSLVGASISYQMIGSGDASNGIYALSTNGNMSAYDYYSLGRYVMTFTALNVGAMVTTDIPTNVRTSLYAADGAYAVRTSTQSTVVTFASFTVTAALQLASNVEDLDMQGRIAVDRTPNGGIEGAFDVTTPTAIRNDAGSYPPITTQGTVVTNNSSTAQYGAVNTIVVSVGTDTPQSFVKEFMLMKQNDFYALEQQLPIVSGTTGTASGTIMSLSALSTGPSASSLACYTDVHVSYFLSTAPTTTIPNWYVHWNSNLSTCVPQANIPYEEATSTTGVASDPCDVGLDINGANFDITSGGVEHFLAAALPQGYYVLSIDNYSCATTVGNTATILIGDYLFGPYTCTYTASDTDGRNPAAWCRVTDVRVNASGVIDVLTPDLAIPPWH